MYNYMALDIKDGDMNISLIEVIKPHYTWLIQSQIHFSLFTYQSWLPFFFLSDSMPSLSATFPKLSCNKNYSSDRILALNKCIGFLELTGQVLLFYQFLFVAFFFFLGSIQKRKEMLKCLCISRSWVYLLKLV